MAIHLTVTPVEKGTLKVTAVFTDEDENSVAPKTLTWTLTDSSGTVINEREDVAVSSPSATQVIMLTGDDLQIPTGGNTARHFYLEGTYDSDNGFDLNIRALAIFTIEDFVVVT